MGISHGPFFLALIFLRPRLGFDDKVALDILVSKEAHAGVALDETARLGLGTCGGEISRRFFHVLCTPAFLYNICHLKQRSIASCVCFPYMSVC